MFVANVCASRRESISTVLNCRVNDSLAVRKLWNMLSFNCEVRVELRTFRGFVGIAGGRILMFIMQGSYF